MELNGMFANSVSIITLEKTNKFYAMACAWATQIDYDRVIMCLGSQSNTGSALAVGDMVGISVLSSSQQDLADKIGSTHSLEVNKKELINFDLCKSVYLLKGAKTKLIGRVIYIDHYREAINDKIVQIRVIEGSIDDNLDFLLYKPH
jgi:flavin reductase (DIM6/NTAB) family NADH-FMN oxidoreductase RutF